MKWESLHFTDNTVRQKLANAGYNLSGFCGSNALLLLEGKFEGQKARQRPARTHTYSTCYNGQREKSMMKLKDRLRT